MSFRPVRRCARKAARPRFFPRLEVLEDRTAPAGLNPIVMENQLPGNSPAEWNLPGGIDDPSIRGYTTEFSVDQGQTVQFKINSTQSDYRIDIYRVGYYGGLGARKVATVNPLTPGPQVQPNPIIDTSTGLIDAGNWAVSATWAVPTTATSGVYLAKLVRTDGQGNGSHIPFIVRDDDGGSDLLFQTSDTTWQAYNSFGGSSLYQTDIAGLPNRGFKVSYNRPFAYDGSGTYFGVENQLLFSEYPMIMWLESNGYDVSYFSGVDTAMRGAEILEHDAFLSVGHDEYWSSEMRSNVEAARDAGVNLAFFSGNEIFWKTRWETSIDGNGTPFRTMVTYKETAANAKIDPSPIWTGTWMDTRFSPPSDGGQPQNALSGQLFAINAYFNARILVPEEEGKLRFWRNTDLADLQPGQVGGLMMNSLGFEADIDADNGFRPAGTFRVSSSTYHVENLLQNYGSFYQPGTATHSMTIYRASSGALVFGAGTIQWSWGLYGDHSGTVTVPDIRMQQATVNLLADMNAQPGTLQAGLVAATASTDTIAATALVNPTLPASVQVGGVVVLSGTAADIGGRVGGVEVTTDGGATWRRAEGRSNWTYTWVPTTAGPADIRARAVDDSANLGAPSTAIAVTVLADNTTAPLITAVTASAPSLSGMTVGWTTDEASTSVVEYGTSPTSLTQSVSDLAQVTAHSLTLTGLAPNTTYYYRVVSTDEFNNTATSPAGSTLTFTTPAFEDASAADFAGGLLGPATYLTPGGDLILGPAVATEFSGTALDPGWQSAPLEPGGTVVVSDGTLKLDGAKAHTTGLYGPGRSLEFDANFNNPVQFVGFIDDIGTVPWAVFIVHHSGELFARTYTGDAPATQTVMLDSFKNGTHHYRIDWNPASVDYWIDGTLVASHALTLNGNLRPFAYDSTLDNQRLVVDSMRLSPYASPGTYTSRVFDAGASVNWSQLTASTDTPAGTAVAMTARSGNTPTPDASWAAFTPVTAQGAITGQTGRYLQYAAELSTTVPAQTPVLKSVTLFHGTTPLPTVAFATASSSGAESTTSAGLAVTLSAASTQTVTVSYAVTGGTATGGGTDYTLPAGTLTFLPGETSKSIALAVVNDALDEANETVAVTLSLPANATLGATTTHTYTITDNDPTPTVAFSAASSSGGEATTPANLTVALSAASGRAVTVNYAATGGTATGGGTDYTLAAGTLTFAPGETSKVIALAIVNDTLAEASETVVLTLSSPTNATVGTNGTHTYTILDNDTGVTVGFTTATSSGSEATLSASLNVALSAASTQTVTVNYAVTGGTATGGSVDYLLPPGTLTFAPGETTKSIPLSVTYDRVNETTEAVVVSLTGPTNATLGATASHTYLIDDNGLSAGTATVAYLSTTAGGTVTGSTGGSVTFTDHDLLRLAVTTTGSYSYQLFFDGSDVGLTTSSEDIDAFAVLPDGSFVFSTVGAFSVAVGSGTLSGGGEDLLRFTPISLGANTAGTWGLYFDGSDVGLSGTEENIDAVGLLPDGRILISTSGNVSVTGVSRADEDILAFTPTSLGATTAGTWAVYLDGSDVGLGNTNEDIDALDVWSNGTGNPTLFFSTTDAFSVPGVSGADEDVFQFNQAGVGISTTGTYASPLSLDGSAYGLGGFDIDGIRLTPPNIGGLGTASAPAVTGASATRMAATSETTDSVTWAALVLDEVESASSDSTKTTVNASSSLSEEDLWQSLVEWMTLNRISRAELIAAARTVIDTSYPKVASSVVDAAIANFLLDLEDYLERR